MRYLLYFLIFSSGLVFHKISNEIHDYKWEQAWSSANCKKAYMDALNDPKEPAPLSVSFRCADDAMGAAYYLRYILMRPMYSLNDGNWGF